MKQLTEELFRYTIVTSDAEELKMEKLSINGILESVITSYYSVLVQQNIEPSISIPDEKVERMLNGEALSRIFGNIISNAVKYSDGDLMISLTETGKITFANHAAGLTEVQVGRLFDRFYTVNNARRSTGLGLSIAKTLTERMGGNIAAEYKDDILKISLKFD